MSVSPALRVSLDLVARGFAEELDLPPLTRDESHRVAAAIRRGGRHEPDLPSLAMLPVLEERGEPASLYGWLPEDAQ